MVLRMATLLLLVLALVSVTACGDDPSPNSPAVVATPPTFPATASKPVATRTPSPPATATAAPFEGTLNGIELALQGDGESPLVLCPPTGWEDVFRTELEALMARAGPLQIDATALPPGVTPSSSPEGFSCKGEPVSVSWTFALQPNMPNVNVGGGGLDISRAFQRDKKVNHSRNDWQPLTVNGHRGIVGGPAWTGNGRFIGGCTAVIFDESTSVMTVVFGFTGTREFCIDVAQRIAR